MEKIQIPKNSFNTLHKPNKLIIVSLLTIIIANCITVLGFKELSLEIKIIICLAIICLILLIDVVVLYIQYYMYYYQSEYLNKIYSLIDINIDNIGNSLNSLELESSDLRDSIELNTSNIKELKSKLL